MIHRREIDGLRAIAVLSVIFFHAGFQVFRGGFVGVDIFFVISGYLITEIIIRETNQDKFSLIDFYERRIRRIMPVLFFVMACCVPAAWLIFDVPRDMKSFSQSLVAVSIFSSNILFWKTSGYFDTTTELKPLIHTWSLSVEEQYYLIFPVFIIFLRRFLSHWVLSILIFILITSITLAQILVSAYPSLAFYLLPTRAWELLLGAVSAIMPTMAVKNYNKFFLEFISLIGVFLILISVNFFNQKTPDPGIYMLMPTIGAAIILIFASENTITGHILGNKFFVSIGLISYSLYLWHQPLLAFTKYFLIDELSRCEILLLIFACFVLSFLTWYFIEKPFRQKDIIPRNKIFYMAILSSALFMIIGIIGNYTNGFEFRISSKPYKIFSNIDYSRIFSKCDATDMLFSSELNYCYKIKEKNIDAVIIGDSHADDKFYGISKSLSAYNWGMIGNSSCPPILGVNVEGDQKGCLEKFENIISWVANNKQIDIVLISFFGGYHLTTAYAADHLKNNTGPNNIKFVGPGVGDLSRADLFYKGISETVAILLNANKSVFFLVDLPELPFFPIDCVKKRIECSVRSKEVFERQEIYRRMLAKLKKDFPKLYLYDPIGLFCNGDACSYAKDGVVLYRDSHHLTAAGSVIYGRSLAEWIKEFNIQNKEIK